MRFLAAIIFAFIMSLTPAERVAAMSCHEPDCCEHMQRDCHALAACSMAQCCEPGSVLPFSGFAPLTLQPATMPVGRSSPAGYRDVLDSLWRPPRIG